MFELVLLLFLFSAPALLVFAKNIMANTYLWQTKEFRLDRMLTFIRYEKDLKDHKSSLLYIKILLLVTALSYLHNIESGTNILSLGTILVFVIYIFEMERFLRDLVQKNIVRPSLRSARSWLIMGATALIIAIFMGMFFENFLITEDYDIRASLETADYQITRESIKRDFLEENETVPYSNLIITINAVILLLIDLLIPLLISIFVLLTEPLALYSRQRIINKAIDKHSKHKKLKIVGITGSYGKSTTKEIISQLLANHVKVAKTDENKNTVVGIAQSYDKNVKKTTDLFVMEVGAYRKGEIAKVVSMFKPDIAVVTALSNQHLSLFGSFQNLFKAKFELIEGLSEEGVAIFNADSEKCFLMAEKTEQKKFFFGRLPDNDTKDKKINKSKNKESQTLEGNLFLKNVIAEGGRTQADIIYNDNSYKLDVNISIPAFMSSLAAALMVGLEMGIPIKELIKSANKTKFKLTSLQEKKGISGETLIDDGKTSNTKGFLMALGVLKEKPVREGRRRWVVTQGVIELGSEKKSSYVKIVDKLKGSADGIITSDKDLLTILKNRDFLGDIVFVKNDTLFEIHYKAVIEKGDLVLLEGNLPPKFLKSINKK